jgi:ABC-type multidrug transport system fused ATPase/permease subunit
LSFTGRKTGFGRKQAGKKKTKYCRLYDPTEGRILLDGKDLKEYELEGLRYNLGIIFQDYIRYQMTFYKTLRLGISKS